MKIKKGDEVIITIGKDSGKKGKVTQVLPKISKLVIAGLNVYKKHLKPQGPQNQSKKGSIIDISKPLPVSNVALVCPKCKSQTKVGYRIEGDIKSRICRKCKEVI